VFVEWLIAECMKLCTVPSFGTLNVELFRNGHMKAQILSIFVINVISVGQCMSGNTPGVPIGAPPPEKWTGQ
jgi:hypothetical protein